MEKRDEKKVRTDWETFATKSKSDFAGSRVTTLRDLEDQVKSIASTCSQVTEKVRMKGWDSPLLQGLRQSRRNCTDAAERSILSKKKIT